jgi:hypothetical protein
MKYRKDPAKSQTAKTVDWVLGMLYIVQLRLRRRDTGEKIKHRILMVGCEAADIERKLKWSFDAALFDEFAVTETLKVKEKIHILSTSIEQWSSPPNAVIAREEGTEEIGYQPKEIERFDPKWFAVGLATVVRAKDADHAIRKVGHALVNQISGDKSREGAYLSENSILTVEEVSKPSGYAMPRDVSKESQKATFVRG